MWPDVAAVVLLWLARFGLKAVVPGFKGFQLGIMGALTGAVVVVAWWAFFSRAPWLERLGAIVLMVAGLGGGWSLSSPWRKSLRWKNRGQARISAGTSVSFSKTLRRAEIQASPHFSERAILITGC